MAARRKVDALGAACRLLDTSRAGSAPRPDGGEGGAEGRAASAPTADGQEEMSGTVGRSRPDLPRTMFLGMLRRTPGGMTVAVLRCGRSLGRIAPPRPSGRRHRRPGLPIWAAPSQRCVTPPSRGHRSPPARATLRITPLVDGNGRVIDLYSSSVNPRLANGHEGILRTGLVSVCRGRREKPPASVNQHQGRGRSEICTDRDYNLCMFEHSIQKIASRAGTLASASGLEGTLSFQLPGLCSRYAFALLSSWPPPRPFPWTRLPQLRRPRECAQPPLGFI